MNISYIFMRFLFVILSLVLFVGAASETSLGVGLGAGFGFALFLFLAEFYFKQTNLKALNTVALGLFFGSFLGHTIHTLFSQALNFEEAVFIKSAIYLFSAYIGVILTIRSSEEIYLSIPFIRFQPTLQKKKDILIDSSILQDTRILDLASSGLVNNLLVLPRFTVKEFLQNPEKGKRAMEIIKKLETMPGLNLRYNEMEFPEIKDLNSKFTRLARLTDSSILTADINRIEQSSLDGITIININMLANSLKPITQSGETLSIKVQRYGKEARQGVGYLEDGTMVVINGGAEFIGETIKAQVLSVKHTSSGRMIFCNASEEGFLSEQEVEETLAQMESSPKNYFSL